MADNQICKQTEIGKIMKTGYLEDQGLSRVVKGGGIRLKFD